MLESGSSDLAWSLCRAYTRHLTVTWPLFVQEYKTNIGNNLGRNHARCWAVACVGLVSHAGFVCFFVNKRNQGFFVSAVFIRDSRHFQTDAKASLPSTSWSVLKLPVFSSLDSWLMSESKSLLNQPGCGLPVSSPYMQHRAKCHK